MNYKNLIIGIVVLIVLVAVGRTYLHEEASLGSSQAGVPASIATSSAYSVGPGVAVEIFSKRSNCSSRIISTGPQAILISVGEIGDYGIASSSLSATGIGLWQGASTTVAYDAGLYGCGLFSVLGQVASSTISVIQFN